MAVTLIQMLNTHKLEGVYVLNVVHLFFRKKRTVVFHRWKTPVDKTLLNLVR